MNLTEFVSNSLRQIVAGVVEASGEIEKAGGMVNPSRIDRTTLSDHLIQTEEGTAPVTTVAFDVALTVGSEEGSRGGLVVFGGAFSIGGGADERSAEQAVSRVRFDVPVVLPQFGREATRPEAPGYRL